MADREGPLIGHRYVLVTAARNEAEYIESTLKSVTSQSVLPRKWVIVSDGSTDATDRIVDGFAKRYGFIELVRRDSQESRTFSSKVHAIRDGLARLAGVQFEFLGNLDADVSFSAEYFERIMMKMHQSPDVGIGGGHLLEKVGGEWLPQMVACDWSVTGGVQFFRRRCFESIGGYTPTRWGGEDMVASAMARMRGWQVRTFRDINALHLRVMGTAGSSLLAGRFMQGVRDRSVRTHPIFEIAKCAKRSLEPPKVLGSLIRLSGFCWAVARGDAIAVPPEVAEFLRREQMARLRDALGTVLPNRDQDGRHD